MNHQLSICLFHIILFLEVTRKSDYAWFKLRLFLQWKTFRWRFHSDMSIFTIWNMKTVLHMYKYVCIDCFVLIMSITRFRVNLLSIVAWMSMNSLLMWLSCVLSNYLYIAFDYMLLSCHVLVSKFQRFLLQTKWLWVGIPLLSLKLQMSRLFQTTIECRFTPKRVRDIIITYNQMHCTDTCSKHSSVI